MFSSGKGLSHPQLPHYHSSLYPASDPALQDLPLPRFPKPDHKRTQSDMQEFAPNFTIKPENRSKRLPCHHQRSYSQNFDLGPSAEDLRVRSVEGWEHRRQKTKSPPITEIEEEDCSESEEVIRRILKEREVSFARASTSKLEAGRRSEDSIVGLQASMSHLLSQRQEDAKKTDTARARLRQEVMKLIQSPSADSSRDVSPETVVTLKSSLASAATVLELNECSESILEFRSEDKRTIVEERKDILPPPFDKSFSKGSEADNTVIADAEALVDSDMSNSQVFSGKGAKLSLLRFKPNNHKLIKNAMVAICLAGEANKRIRDEVIKVMASRRSTNNFVIAFKGTLGRHELGALYEHDQSQGYLKKIFGPGTYPDQVTSALVQSCYRYDSSSREFKFLQNRRFAFGMDAVSLHRRV